MIVNNRIIVFVIVKRTRASSYVSCAIEVIKLLLLLLLFDMEAQVAQARYMSSSMWTFALLCDSSDLHIYKDLYGERSKPEKKRKITVELQ